MALAPVRDPARDRRAADPRPARDAGAAPLAAAIADGAGALAARPDDCAADLALERLVARLYGLDRAALAAAAAVLDAAERLEGIRELRFDPRAIA